MPLPLHQRSPEVHAAIHAVAEIAIGWREGRADLYEELTRFFDSYDTLRAEQVETLKAEVIALKMRVVDPIILAKGKPDGRG